MKARSVRETKDFLNICSLKHLALQLHIDEAELTNLADNIEAHYRYEMMEKKRKDGSVKIRKIYHPSRRLKKALQAINGNLLIKIKVPDEVHGSRAGRSNVTMAREHVGKKYVQVLDIKNFFPSVRPYNVYQTFLRLRCSPEIAGLLTRLCTADNHLPQGYNTSPYIANLVLVTPMRRIGGLCRKTGRCFTGFVDDQAISGNQNPAPLVPTIRKIMGECGHALKDDKDVCRHRSQQQKVTNVVVNAKPNIDKASYEELRSFVFLCRKHGPSALLERGISNSKGERIDTPARLKNHLAGRLSYLKYVNAARAQKLLLDFRTITWGG